MSLIRPGPRAHHHDAGREEDGLRDRVGDEDDGRARPMPRCCRTSVFRRSRVISSSAPNGSSISRSAGCTTARGRWRRAAACRRTAAAGSGCAKPPSSTSSSISLDAFVPFGLSAPSELERQAHVFLAPSASRTGPVPGRPCRTRDPAGPAWAGLPLTSTAPGCRPDQVADDAQQRRLAATGRSDQRHELARADVPGRCHPGRSSSSVRQMEVSSRRGQSDRQAVLPSALPGGHAAPAQADASRRP